MVPAKKVNASETSKAGTKEKIQEFLFDSVSEFSSLSEDSSSRESSYEPHEELQSETDEEIVIEDAEDDLPADSGDDIDENALLTDIASTSKTKKCTASNNTKVNKKKKRKTVGKYQNAKWQKELPAEGMKRIQFSGTPFVSNRVQSAEPLEIFELMFTDELVGHITQQTNLYFMQNIVGETFKKHSRIQKHLSFAKSELCTANNICLFIASILYRGVIQKPVAHMFYTKSKLFETPGFKKILPQDRLVLLEKYIHFVDISKKIV